VTEHRDKFLMINQLDALISQIYFWNETLHVSDSYSVHHHQFFTVHTAMVYAQWKTPDDGQSYFPKHVAFNSKNKFEKLVHLVGFIIRRNIHKGSTPNLRTIKNILKFKNIYIF